MIIPLMVNGQELFIHNEPASTMPKGLMSYRYSTESYQDENIRRHWHALRLMYGVTANLTLMLTGSVSNHHPGQFPADPWQYFLNHHNIGYDRNYPLRFEGFHLYGKYRVFSHDEHNSHLRIAFFGEASNTMSAHDEAEPHLMGDNAGFGGGLIVTKLYRKLAVSATAGFIRPLEHVDESRGIRFKSGNAEYVNVSAGYLIYPKSYDSYDDLNVNIYLETHMRKYEEGQLYLNDKFEFIDFFPFLRRGAYAEVRPGIQFIFDSRTRIDFSLAFTAYGSTYIRRNPTVFINFQKYLFD